MKYRFREKTMTMPAGMAIGAVVEIALTVLLAAMLVNMILAEKFLEQNIGYGIFGILMTAPMIGGMTACSVIRRRKVLICFGMGGVYLALLLSLTMLFFGGQYQGITAALLPIAGGSCAAALLMAKEKQKRSVRGKRKKK